MIAPSLFTGGIFVRTKTLYIAVDNVVFESFIDCLQYERHIEEKKKREHAQKVREASNQFLVSVGFSPNIYHSLWEKNAAINRSWLVFDEFGNIEGLKTCDNRNYPENGCDFCFVSGENKEDRTILENWLTAHRLYAHRLSSFVEQSYLEFYKWGFVQKLENLGWIVKNGVLL